MNESPYPKASTVRAMTPQDVATICAIHTQNFPRQAQSQLWLTCHLVSFPKDFVYLIEVANHQAGYIIWSQKSGFRKKVILELTQVAIAKDYQSQGYATQLISASLLRVKAYLTKNQQELDKIYISTGANNQAKRLYEKLFNAKIEASFTHLYNQTDDEIILIARNLDTANLIRG